VPTDCCPDTFPGDGARIDEVGSLLPSKHTVEFARALETYHFRLRASSRPQADGGGCEDGCSDVLRERFWEFSSVAVRLEWLGALDETCAIDTDELWKRRSRLARELIDMPAPTIADVLFKMTIVSSLVEDEEVSIGLTPQCIEECEWALGIETGFEQSCETLEPALWSSYQLIRQKLAAIAAEDFEFSEGWSTEVLTSIHAVACQEAKTAVGLRAKGEIFREIWLFAEEMEFWGALQISYIRDFGVLASAKLRLENGTRSLRKTE
jgi:hypothetical protein